MATTDGKHSRRGTGHEDRAAEGKSSAAVPHLSVTERVARGKAARKEVPRATTRCSSRFRLALIRSSCSPASGEDAGAGAGADPLRADAGLAVHVLSRGGAAHGAGPGGDPAVRADVQCCGDAHLSNFGVFASPERALVFDVNDFDETLPGPWEWDVKRLAVSMLIAARYNDFRPRSRTRS